MNNVQALARLFAVACLAAAASIPSDAYAARIGYYFNCDGAGRTLQQGPITTAGHTPINVSTPDSATLSGLDALVVDMDYCSNSEYIANQSAINTAVNGGLVLIVHDRQVSNVGALLPGGRALVTTNANQVDIDFPAGSPLVSGPGGALSNSSLDNGTSSNHGAIAASSLPSGTRILANDSNPSNAVTLSYSYGAGRVVYSTIPFDYYLSGGGPAGVQANMVNRYMPNLLAWAVGPGFTSCVAEGFSGGKLTMCQKVCEIDQSPSMLTSLIRLYRAAYREDPPCAN